MIATPIYQEMNVPDDKTGLIFTAFSAGLTIGAFTFGLAVDIIGRKWAFNTTVLICCFFVSTTISSKTGSKGLGLPGV